MKRHFLCCMMLQKDAQEFLEVHVRPRGMVRVWVWCSGRTRRHGRADVTYCTAASDRLSDGLTVDSVRASDSPVFNSNNLQSLSHKCRGGGVA